MYDCKDNINTSDVSSMHFLCSCASYVVKVHVGKFHGWRRENKTKVLYHIFIVMLIFFTKNKRYNRKRERETKHIQMYKTLGNITYKLALS